MTFTESLLNTINTKIKEGYKLSNDQITELLEAIAKLAKDPLTYTSLKRLYSIFFEDNKKLNDILTKRELEILSLIDVQKNSLEISNALDIKLSTVETHRKNIRRKLHIKSTSALYHYAKIANLLIQHKNHKTT